MRLQAQLTKDLISAMKEKDEEKKSAMRVVMGEFGRLEKKELADDDVISVLKKLIKAEKEMLDAKGETADSGFIITLEKYLPVMASEDEIRVWIQQNVDFTQFNNRMQAMKPIMSHFGSSADGNIIKKILQSI
ncbi:MAG: GatB/YqeY domain-containing protein [Deltaproteobacteria bacterium]|nr:GatB/YqeY domain-containing protein [Deltaproteobacteria bacterium]